MLSFCLCPCHKLGFSKQRPPHRICTYVLLYSSHDTFYVYLFDWCVLYIQICLAIRLEGRNLGRQHIEVAAWDCATQLFNVSLLRWDLGYQCSRECWYIGEVLFRWQPYFAVVCTCWRNLALKLSYQAVYFIIINSLSNSRNNASSSP